MCSLLNYRMNREIYRTLLSNEGYLILGSGMAVHSFTSVGEIHQAGSEEEKKNAKEKVLAESRSFDTQLRNAVTKRDAAEREAALLNLESLHEFKRSHPTVEVSLAMSLNSTINFCELVQWLATDCMPSTLHLCLWRLGRQETQTWSPSVKIL